MTEPDDDTVARTPGDEATVIGRRRRADAAPSGQGGTEPSPAEDETVIRPRASARGSVRDETALASSPPRRTASDGQPDDTVYRPRPADPVIVPRPHR